MSDYLSDELIDSWLKTINHYIPSGEIWMGRMLLLIQEVKQLREWKSVNQRAIASASTLLLLTGAVPIGVKSLGEAASAVTLEVERLRTEIERLQKKCENL